MRLSILFGQRKEHYEGEYAPEALLVWDEYARDYNPEDFDEALEKAKAEQGDGMQAFKVIDIEVDQDKIPQAPRRRTRPPGDDQGDPMTVDELVTQLQAVQARGGGKLQVAHPLTVGQPSKQPAPKVVYQLAVIATASEVQVCQPEPGAGRDWAGKSPRTSPSPEIPSNCRYTMGVRTLVFALRAERTRQRPACGDVQDAGKNDWKCQLVRSETGRKVTVGHVSKDPLDQTTRIATSVRIDFRKSKASAQAARIQAL